VHPQVPHDAAIAEHVPVGKDNINEQLLTYVTGYGKTDHSRQTLNLRYVSSKFNSQYANFDRVRYF